MAEAQIVNKIRDLLQGRMPPDDEVDAVFIFGRAMGDWEQTEGDSGLLETAVSILNATQTPRIVIPGTAGGATHSGEVIATTYPGPEVWKQYLLSLGVPERNIYVTVPAPVHTCGDSDSFIAHCKKEELQYVGILTQPHHALRSMLAILKSMQLHDYLVDVTPFTPLNVNWKKRVYGSQGAELLPRENHSDLEWQRIIDQQEKGWLASFEDLLAYLKA